MAPVCGEVAQRCHPMQIRAKNGVFKPKNWGYFLADCASSVPVVEPVSIKKALCSALWKTTMDNEMATLIKNKTWRLVPPPPNINLIECKWVFKVKTKSDGSFDRCKARLVAKGFNQVPSVDFHETFSPIVKAPTIRIILALAVSKGWIIRQLDVNNAFLNGRLKEAIFMKQPDDYVDSHHPEYMCVGWTVLFMVSDNLRGLDMIG